MENSPEISDNHIQQKNRGWYSLELKVGLGPLWSRRTRALPTKLPIHYNFTTSVFNSEINTDDVHSRPISNTSFKNSKSLVAPHLRLNASIYTSYIHHSRKIDRSRASVVGMRKLMSSDSQIGRGARDTLRCSR